MGSSELSGFTIWMSPGSTRAVKPLHPPTLTSPTIVSTMLLTMSHVPCAMSA
jgi:hypothetical protein